jgi:hypothetical protein
VARDASEADKRDVWQVPTAERAYIFDLERANDDLVAEAFDHACDRVELLVALVGDQYLEVRNGLGHRPALPNVTIVADRVSESQRHTRVSSWFTGFSLTEAPLPVAFLIDRDGLARMPALGHLG